MVEKFSDYEGSKYLNEEGTFVFEITSAELTESKNHDPMVKLEVKSDAGTSTIYHSLLPKARWSYNNLIAACFKLTPEQKKTYELDYQTIHTKLVGTKFTGKVQAETYIKTVKVPMDDGTFEEAEQTKTAFRIVEYTQA